MLPRVTVHATAHVTIKLLYFTTYFQQVTTCDCCFL